MFKYDLETLKPTIKRCAEEATNKTEDSKPYKPTKPIGHALVRRAARLVRCGPCNASPPAGSCAHVVDPPPGRDVKYDRVG